MRVLITVPDLNELGGVANYYRALQGRFVNQVDYLKIGGWQGISSKSKVQLLGLFVKDIFRIARRVRHYDIVHFNPSFSKPCFFREMILLFVVKLFRRKVIIFFRGWDRKFAETVGRKLRWIFSLGYRRTDAFIVLADDFRKQLVAWGYKGPVYLETTLVDDRELQFGSESAMRASGGPLKLLYLARLERAKGVFQCVEALSRFSPEEVSLTVAGNGNDREELERCIAEKGLKNIRLEGWVSGERKALAFSAADGFLFPSQHGEGMPNTVLEAMAYGLPVITAPVGGVKDFFEDGKMGFLIDPVTSENLAECIQRLLNHPETRKQIGEYNRNYAKEHFYASCVVKRLESIYAEVLDGRTRPEKHVV